MHGQYMWGRWAGNCGTVDVSLIVSKHRKLRATGCTSSCSIMCHWFTVHCAANANMLMLNNLYWKEVKANNSSSTASAILEWKRLSPLDSSSPYRKYHLICKKKKHKLQLKYNLNDYNNNVQSLDLLSSNPFKSLFTDFILKFFHFFTKPFAL